MRPAIPSFVTSGRGRELLSGLRRRLQRDDLSLVAAGSAFYGLLALFPALAALVSFYGLFADPGSLAGHAQTLGSVLPAQAVALIHGQLSRVAARSGGTLGASALLGMAITLWSATRGVRALVSALVIVQGHTEERGRLRLEVLALRLTLGGLCVVAFALALIVAVPAAMRLMHLYDLGSRLLSAARWPILAAFFLGALALLYRAVPSSRTVPHPRFFSLGSVVATALWLAWSAAFSFYVAHVADYDRLYGSIGAIVILMLWLYASAYSALVGAVLDSEHERVAHAHAHPQGPEPLSR